MKEISKKIPIIVLTDISTDCAKKGEPDDTQSLIRLLLYSDVFDIRGLVATYTPHRGCACPEYINFVIDNYKKVYPNLIKTNRPFAVPEQLYNTVKKGCDSSGFPDRHTEGSELIVKEALSSDEPIWIAVWGGVGDLMQAILDARASLCKADFLQFCKKLRVYSIGDQYDDCGAWIRKNCPDIFYITSYNCFRGMYRMGNSKLCDDTWVKENVTSIGELGKIYPNYSGGDAYSGILGLVKGVKEGDTPSFLHLIPNGLCDPLHPEYGSWGGLFESKEANRYFDTPVFFENNKNYWASVYRHRMDYQNDFAVRLKWSAGELTYVDYPKIVLNVEGNISIKPREKIILKAEADIDCNLVWQYCPESGDFDGVLAVSDKGDGVCEIHALPAVESVSPKTAHLILKTTTKTSPYLVCYKRVVINIS